MGADHSKRKKKRRDTYSFEEKYRKLSREDKEEIDLLNLQEKAIGLLLYSDLCFYLNVNQNIEILLDTTEDKLNGINKIIKSLSSFYAFAFIGLIGMTSILVVDFTRYNNLSVRHKIKDINYSIMPELYIYIGGFFQVICYKYFVVASIEFYKRAKSYFYFIYDSNRNLLLNITYLMRKASIIRICADAYFYQSTIYNINKIYSRYEDRKKELKTENPDLLLLQGATLYLTARVLIAKDNICILNEVYNDTNSEIKQAYLKPNQIVVIGNILGVIGNMYGVNGVAYMYIRNSNSTILGV